MNDNERKLDELLDQTLAEYSNAEPRVGLEGRILANLSAQPRSQNESWFRWPIVGLAATAALIALALLLWPKQPRRQEAAIQTPVQSKLVIPEAAPTQMARVVPPRMLHVRPSARRVVPAPGPQPVAQIAAVVKQDVFPAASPLTEQERLIFAYLRKTAASEVVMQSKPDEVIDVFQPPNRVQLSRPTDSSLGR